MFYFKSLEFGRAPPKKNAGRNNRWRGIVQTSFSLIGNGALQSSRNKKPNVGAYHEPSIAANCIQTTGVEMPRAGYVGKLLIMQVARVDAVSDEGHETSYVRWLLPLHW